MAHETHRIEAMVVGKDENDVWPALTA